MADAIPRETIERQTMTGEPIASHHSVCTAQQPKVILYIPGMKRESMDKMMNHKTFRSAARIMKLPKGELLKDCVRTMSQQNKGGCVSSSQPLKTTNRQGCESSVPGNDLA